MRALLEYTIKADNFISQDLLNSRYLTENVAGELPLKALLREDTPAMVSSFLSKMLRESLTTPEQWLTFETLAQEFQGSIKELLQLVTNL
jgi:hypothetical protein